MTEDMKEPRIEGDALIIETAGETEVYDAQYLVAALLVYVAKGDGAISEQETERMLSLIGEHFGIPSADSLALLTRAISDLAANPDLESLIRQLGAMRSEAEREDMAVMMMKVTTADGEADVDEMERMSRACELIGISPETRHRAFDRYFAETSADDDPDGGMVG